MLNRNAKQTARRSDRDGRKNRRRWHTLERLESRCVLAANLSGQVFDDLNGDQIWQPSAPNNEPALDCWNVFVDSNKNGVLDQGEPQQLTSSDGSYSFNLSAPGEYSVELVQEPGFDRTTPIRFGLNTTLVSGSVQDHVFDPVRSVLYGTDGNRVLRTNPLNGDTLAALSFGTSLSSIDITPDGKYLLVGESTTVEGSGKLYKIDLQSSVVTTISYSLVGQEGGVFDVAAVSNEKAIFTTTSGNSGRVPLREVNLTTNAVTTRAETFGAGNGDVLPGSRLERNAGRSKMVLVAAKDPTGSIYLYDSATNSFPRSAQLSQSLDNAHVAISRDGKRIAVQASGLGLKVYDDQLVEVAGTLPNLQGGIAFDSVRNILYAGDTATDQLVAFDTASGTELYRVAVGEDLLTSGTYYEMQVNTRGKFLSVTTPTGVRYAQLDRPVSRTVTVTENQTVSQLDFGNWINGSNRRPKASTDNYSIAEDEVLSISAPGVLGNDSDPDGDPVQVQVVTGAQNGSVNLLANGSFLYTPNDDFFGSDSFIYRASDGVLSSCRAATVHVNVTPVNDAPLDISLNGTVVEENAAGGEIGQIVVVEADPSDQITLQVSDGRFEIVNGKLRLKDGVILNHEQSATIEVTVTATDNGSPPLSTSEVFTIEVKDINEFDPIIETIVLDVPEDGTTVGTVQTRDNDSSQTIQVTIVGGNDGGIFSIDPNTGVISVNAGHPLDHEGTQIHILTVRVEDSVAPRRTTTADVTIRITDVNESDPQVEDAVFEVSENAPAGTVVGQVVASDADTSQDLIYGISEGNDSGIFSINSSTGAITVADGSLLDREQAGEIVLTVSVTDSGVPARTSSADVTINILNVNEFDPLLTDQIVMLDENAPNGTLVSIFPAFDADAVSDMVFSITGGNADGAFSIDSQTGEIRVANSPALDAEARSRIELEITVTDETSPSRSSTGTVTIDLLDLNEFDPQPNDETFNVPVDAAIGFDVGTVTATDQDQTQIFGFEITGGNDGGIFAINSATGAITVANNAPLQDGETTQYPLTVTVSNSGTPTRAGTADITINVVPANTTAPTLNDAVFSLAENSAAGTVVGSVTATDPDQGTTFTYSISSSGDSTGVFAINATSGQITVADPSALNFESTNQFVLTIVVNDGGTPSKSDEAQITINLTDVNEATPSINGMTVTIAENTANGTVVGTAAATDGDSRQSIIYSISGTAFAINSTTGVITVADSSQLNYESSSSLVVSITATDSGTPAKSGSANLTVNLTNVNEAAPVVSDATFSIVENPTTGTVLGRITATDADNQVLVYALTGGNFNDAFAINSANGEITVANRSVIDAEMVPQFLLLVTVTDDGGQTTQSSMPRSATATVTVNVRDVNEAPIGLSLSSNNVPRHISGSQIGLVSVIDADGGDVHTLSVDDTRFTVNASRMLTLKDGVFVSEEAGSTIQVTITATDSGGLSKSQTFVLNVVGNPNPWRNHDNPLDVNGDGQITPSDILRVINEINSPKSTDLRGRLPAERPDIPDVPFYDVNGDGMVSPIDVLIIINELNRRSGNNQAEGESGYVRIPDTQPATKPVFVPNVALPLIASQSSGKSSRTALRDRDLNDLEETLDDLAEDIAESWGASV